MDFCVTPRQRNDSYIRISVSGLGDWDWVSALALGDGIHIPALVDHLGEGAVGFLSSFPGRGMTYIVGFPFPDWD